ncbi:pilus assembly protein [Microvirga terricola]|uniref:Pilus assembly protein n=1 Tax=Microvirga terricola TaxID=2719797 RepID=A0ABX0VHI0_9HYPH|nr:pilus assembly protein [Microvirga terricola]NIX78375.1 pilus assembly protein [Microvirga terricola]
MVSLGSMVRAALVSVIASQVIGCAEYVDRKNTIAFSAGNAVQTNIVTHVIDPWPASSRNTAIAFDGQRMQRAVENYRCGKGSARGNDDGGEGAASQAQGGQGVC